MNVPVYSAQIKLKDKAKDFKFFKFFLNYKYRPCKFITK